MCMPSISSNKMETRPDAKKNYYSIENCTVVASEPLLLCGQCDCTDERSRERWTYIVEYFIIAFWPLFMFGSATMCVVCTERTRNQRGKMPQQNIASDTRVQCSVFTSDNYPKKKKGKTASVSALLLSEYTSLPHSVCARAATQSEFSSSVDEN